MRTRDELYHALMNRLRRVGAEERSDLLFTAEADRDAVELAAQTDLDTDVDAPFMLGMFHWLRFQMSHPGSADDELAMAARFLAPVYRVWPERVPEDLHHLCAAVPAVEWTDEKLIEVSQKAFEASNDYERTGNPLLAQYAVRMFRTVINARGPAHPDYPRLLADLAIALLQLFQETAEFELVREAIEVGYAGIEAAGADTNHPSLPVLRMTQGTALTLYAQRPGNSESLDQSVVMCRAAVAGVPEGDSNLPAAQINLAQTLVHRFERDHHIEDLNEAIGIASAAVPKFALDHPNAHNARFILGAALDRHAGITGDAGLLSEAAEAARTVLDVTPTQHPGYLAALWDYAFLVDALYLRTGQLDELEHSIELLHAAIPHTAEGSRDRRETQSALSNRLTTLAEYLEDETIADEAVRFGRTVMGGFEHDEARAAAYAVELAHALALQFRLVGSPGPLVEAVDLMRASVARTPIDDAQYALRASDLAGLLRERFLNGGNAAELTEAVELARAAVGSAVGDASRALYQVHLSNALATLFEHTGELSHLIEAIELERASVAAIADARNRAMAQSNLANSLRRLFERTGEAKAAFEALNVSRAVVAGMRENDPRRAANWSHLELALQVVYSATGAVEHLKEGVEFGRAAVAAGPVTRPGQPVIIASHVNTLVQLARATGDTEYLVEAVRVGRDAVAATAPGQPNRAVIMSSAGTAHFVLFQRTGYISYLNDAIRLCNDAVDEAPETHANRAQYVVTLATMINAYFDVTGQPEALAEAIRLARVGLELVPVESERAQTMLTLASFLRDQTDSTGDLTPLEEGLALNRSALEILPTSHPDWPAGQFNLGLALTDAFRRTGTSVHRQQARERFRLAAETADAAPLIRIQSYLRIAALREQGAAAAAEAVEAIEDAVRLLPRLTPQALGRSDREYHLVRAGALPELAAASALAAGRPDRAAELLERTRGLLVADALVARSSDMALVEELAPELAGSFREVRQRLDQLERQSTTVEASPSGRADEAAAAGWLTRARNEAEADQTRVIEAIHALDGLEGFLDAPHINDLTAQARDGRIVFVIAGETRCHALVLTGDAANPAKVVHLDGLSESAVFDRTRRLQAARQTVIASEADPESRIAAQAEMLDIFGWLWDAVAGPVLEAIGHTETPAGPETHWPRVWWCPVGIFSNLPLHAAGHHEDLDAEADLVPPAHPRTVLDRVVSSYITTVRALAYARAHQPTATETMVIVAAPDVPDQEPLDGVEVELEELTELLPAAACLPEPDRQSVLDALPDHLIAHFACHAVVDLVDLGNSRLVLPDHRTEPLTLVDISALRITGGLAFLSACDTNVSANPRLADEAVHITGAFHLAGYQHVVGTLWPIADSAARRIAADFYAYLTEDGTAPPDTGRSAFALHFATRRLRKRWRASPAMWAAHTHTGI